MRHNSIVTHPAAQLQSALALRAIGLLVFPLATVLSAGLQRSWLIVAALALAMLVTSHVERLRLARLMKVPARPSLAGFVAGLAIRSGALLGLFVVSTGLLALFRTTALAQGLGLPDIAIVSGALALALIANEISARIAVRQTAGPIASVQAAFREAGQRAGGVDGVILEGEIIPDNDNTTR